VDLNCDVGEADTPEDLAREASAAALVTSVSVACGFHAGDPGQMKRMVELAAAGEIAVGVHPGFPDREGRGRRPMQLRPEEAYDLVLYQIGALDAFARRAGIALQHVKPHGALYNMAARQRPLAEAVVAATHDFRGDLVFVGLPGSEMEHVALNGHVPFAAEAFADRSYEPDGTLTPRGEPGAVIDDPEIAAARAVEIVRDGRIRTRGGVVIPMRADTLCIHGDNPHAERTAQAIRRALGEAGIEIAPFGTGPR
jgi:UPF0271 protein